jgi:ketosteroid isomerase-like protein
MTQEETIDHFYSSFKNSDVNGMIDCYAENIHFSDPIFGTLRGEKAKAMWMMLLERSKGNLSINYEVTSPTSAKWIATYHYGPKKRKVINEINAYFEFKDGKISKHTDHFDLAKWSRQALGVTGIVLGKTKWFQRKISENVNSSLERFMEKI